MRLSYSKLLTYRTCPKKYQFKYVDHIPEAENEQIKVGKLGHEILEKYYMIPNETRSQSNLDTLAIALGTPLGRQEQMLQIFEGYHEWANNNPVLKDSELSLLTPEVNLQAKINEEDSYEGRIDAITKYNDNRIVLEHKFKAKWSEDYVNNLTYDEQPVSYAMLAGINAVYYNLVRTVPAKTRPKFERVLVMVPQSETSRLQNDANMWRVQMGVSYELKQFPRNRGFQCTFCPYKEMCLNGDTK